MTRLLKSLLCLFAIVLVVQGCKHEDNRIVVPVAGFSKAMAQQKDEGLEAIRQEFPQLRSHELEALSSIPRTFFVLKSAQHRSYDDKSLPIGSGQSTLKLSDIAFLLSELSVEPSDVVLEIGSGTGYFAMVLSRLCSEVYSVEILEYLWEMAIHNKELFKIENVHFRNEDGLSGWSLHAPYDVIVVTAGVEKIPEPLLEQLKPEGRIAVPIMDSENGTDWKVYRYRDGELEETAHRKSNVQAAILVAQP